MMLKRKGRFSKFMVSFVITLNIVFAAAVLHIVANGGMEPSALVVSWYAFTTGELLFLSSIKKKKVNKEEKK